MKKTLILLILCVLVLPAAAANPYKVQTDNAEESFKKGDYAKTIEIYETLIRVEKANNPYIYYNLANAYYRNGNIGRAVLNIEKAAKLAPRDKDIKNNKAHINAVAGKSYAAGTVGYFTGFYTLNEITVLVFAAAALLAVFLSLFIIKRKKYMKKAAVILFLFLIPLLTVFFLKAYADIYIKKAVVVDTAQARSGPGENNPEVAAVPAGETVEITAENAGWYRIKTQSAQNEIDGWIEKNKTGMI